MSKKFSELRKKMKPDSLKHSQEKAQQLLSEMCEADQPPLTETQILQIKERVPKGNKCSIISSVFDTHKNYDE